MDARARFRVRFRVRVRVRVRVRRRLYHVHAARDAVAATARELGGDQRAVELLLTPHRLLELRLDLGSEIVELDGVVLENLASGSGLGLGLGFRVS